MRAAGLRRLLLLLLAALAAAPGGGGAAAAEQGGLPAKKLRMAYATGPLLKFQICAAAASLALVRGGASPRAGGRLAAGDLSGCPALLERGRRPRAAALSVGPALRPPAIKPRFSGLLMACVALCWCGINAWEEPMSP
ncbi:unnamed protein product [Coccothraustes coccothraustes]